jgi:hypothetical protein
VRSCVMWLAVFTLLPGVVSAQLSVAFHGSSFTADAMLANQAPEQQGSIVNTSGGGWVNVVAANTAQSFSFGGLQVLLPNGRPSGATISGTVGAASTVDNGWADGSKDHVMMAGWFGLRGDEYIQVDDIPADYQDGFSVRIYSNRDDRQQPMALHINGERKVIAPWGAFDGLFRGNVNHVTFTGLTGTSVRIHGNPATSPGNARAAINGIQIFKGLPPVAPVGIVGSESPNVHSPGSPIAVTVTFNHPVTLSREGGATLRLDFEGQQVDAVQTGAVAGESLAFVAKAPSVTTMKGKVLANSLALQRGVTLQDGTQENVSLAHGEVALPNDQISVQGLSVYPHVPGLAPSPRYRFRVRKLGSDEWESPFAFMTFCPPVTAGQSVQAYWRGLLGGWTQTYCNFELANNVMVEVEITRLDPATGKQKDIRTAVPHPRRKVRSWRVEDGRVYVMFDKPALFMVDIDGGMDEWPVPRHPATRETRIRRIDEEGVTNDDAQHQVAIFANPFILDKPDLNDPTVYAVEPGTIPPVGGDWQTLYFKPGVHALFEGPWTEASPYLLTAGKSYYIPGDALIHGNMRGGGGGEGPLRIFGHGTLTAERITHALHQNPRPKNRGLTSILRPGGGPGSRIEGITLADSPDHSLWFGGAFDRRPETFNYARWLKVFTWRANGDGITIDGNVYLEDSFLRLQDDGSYIRGRGYRRMVYWTDSNGVSLKSNMIMRMDPDHYVDRKFYVEDIDIIYGRHHNPGFDVRHTVLGGGANFRPPVGFDGVPNQGSHIVFRNINFSDPLPFRTLFSFGLRGGPENHMYGMRFENVRATAPFFTGGKPALNGKSNGIINQTVMHNVVVGGQQLKSADDVSQNEFVKDTIFLETEPTTRKFHNRTGYNKWYMRQDWCGEVEPADHDLVKHTEVAGTLVVDCPAWAGTLAAAHAEKAAIRLEYSGRLFVSDKLTLGDNKGGRGDLQLVDGEVVLRKASADALVLANGGIHMEKNGLLIWAGDRAADVKALLDAGRITLGPGRSDIPQAAPYDRVRWAIEQARAEQELQKKLVAAAENEAASVQQEDQAQEHSDTDEQLDQARAVNEPATTELPGDPSPVLVGQVGEYAVFADYGNINPGFTTFWTGPVGSW